MTINIAQPQIGQEEIDAVTRVMRTGVLAQGPEVFAFEKEFAEFVGVKHAIATSNGSTALLVALMALLEQNKNKKLSLLQKLDQNHNPYYKGEVITTPFTFLASASSIVLAGLKPVFVDIDPNTFCIDTSLIEKAITSRTVAIMPVSLYGNVCDMDRINEIANKYNLAVVEDAAQSHGAKYGERMSGSLGTISCFSFYPTKNMTTGEGGMITTDDDDLAQKCRLIRAHGMSQLYQYDYLGFNYRMTSIGAAIGREQLKKLPDWNNKRISNARFYNDNLKGVKTPYNRREDTHCYHQYTIKTERRDELKKFLADNGVNAGIYYPAPLYEFDIMKAYKANCPVAEKVSKQVLSLPVHPGLSQEDLQTVVDLINKFYE
jgi:dTDP-4-amino-4,6-dideoxygalactose transaminase